MFCGSYHNEMCKERDVLIILSYHRDDVFDNTFCYLDYSWLHRFGFGRSSLVGWCRLQIDLPEKNLTIFSLRL